MEVRVRGASGLGEDSRFEAMASNEASKYVKMSDLNNTKPKLWRRAKHEAYEMVRVTVNMLKGQGSKFSYLFIPAFISLFWLVICFVTTRNPNVTLEDQYIRVRQNFWRKIHLNYKWAFQVPTLFTFLKSFRFQWNSVILTHKYLKSEIIFFAPLCR